MIFSSEENKFYLKIFLSLHQKNGIDFLIFLFVLQGYFYVLFCFSLENDFVKNV